jgi:hypothetical protein
MTGAALMALTLPAHVFRVGGTRQIPVNAWSPVTPYVRITILAHVTNELLSKIDRKIAIIE